MPTREAVKWFKRQFNRSMERAVRETIFSTDMLTAIACQETGYIWNTLRTKNLPLNKLLELCVGDTIDASRGRKAFPKTKADGGIVRRKTAANASSLNEPNLPGRKGTTAAELREEIADIINWLAVENPEHRRYQPYSGCTFCNVYAHDYCYLSGVFLPRVWWTTKAILELARGEMLQPKYDSNIREMRANDLFHWFREFGADFGWRQTGTLNKLQTEVNQGAVGVIIAKRREENKSGHIAAVVPETESHKAKRNSSGDVIAPLQSQAGISNFRYGGTAGWWNSEKFSDSAFWIHS